MNKFCKALAFLLLAAMLCTAFGIEPQSATSYAENFAVGSHVTFGTYPQTAEGDDDTPIEWLVLDRDGDKALLLSRYGLDVQPYNKKYEDITWENCTLRAWLNDDFISRAFTSEEQSAILLTYVDNSGSQGYWDTKGGNDTQDKMFLLSYAEASEYLGVMRFDSSNTRSRIAPTAYAKARGASTSSGYATADGEAAGCWWLRSPGSSLSFASYVNSVGSLDYHLVHYDINCVRPALWVNLGSEIFCSQ